MCRFPDHDDYSLVCLSLIRSYPFLEDRMIVERKGLARFVSIFLLYHMALETIVKWLKMTYFVLYFSREYNKL